MSRYEGRSMKELAEDSIHVQSACNLRAIAASYVEVLDRLGALQREDAPGATSTNCAAITAVWADKIGSLAGIQGMSFPDFTEVYAVIDAIAERKV